MKSKYKHVTILVVSILFGLLLTFYSQNYERVTESIEVDSCLGPAVVFYECPDLPTKVVSGYPFSFNTQVTQYEFDDNFNIISYETITDETITSEFSLAMFILDVIIITGISYILFELFYRIYSIIFNKKHRK